jgi:hypothetical protein
MPYLRRIFVSLILCVLLVGFLPLGLYWLGLGNIEGRPSPPLKTADAASDNALLQQDLRRSTPIRVVRVSPWSYVASMFAADIRQYDPNGGSRAAFLVADHYNQTHLKNRTPLWWDLSGASLMIWLTRNWTPDQVVVAAAAIVRSTPPHLTNGSSDGAGRLR